MFHLVDAALEAFVRTQVPLDPTEVDIAFEAPTTDWSARLSRRPTIDLFLWDARTALAERDVGVVPTVTEDGSRRWEQPWPTVALRYLVTAWTTDPQDEHALAGAVMQLLSTSPVLPAEFATFVPHDRAPLPSIQVGNADAQGLADIWNALGGQLKLALDLQVTTVMPRGRYWPAGPPVRRIDLNLSSMWPGGRPRESRTLHDVDANEAESPVG